ncbi:MAG: hypothetical protein FIA99_06185 [Ruminiclostridium sp.]|nr:hypothetical protein [Ruminiclostridium sp.]
MEYTFFWTSAVVSMLILAAAAILKGTNLPAWIIGISTVAYSTVFDIAFGVRLGLYYYITPEESTLYILLGVLFVYTPLNIVYVVFLPENLKKILIYTVIWIAAMLVFEYASILTGSIVLTGWVPMPWSIVTYAVTYTWIILFYRYLLGWPLCNNSLR